MRKLLDALYGAAGVLAALLLVGICAVVTAQVGLNLLDRLAILLTGRAVGLTIPSYADFAGFFLAGASFLALATSLRHGSHIRVTLVLAQLPMAARRVVELGCTALAAAISAYAAWYFGNLTYESWIFNDLSPGMVAVPIWIPQAAMLVGLVILTVALIDDFVCLLAHGRASWHGTDAALLNRTGGTDTDAVPPE